MGDLRERVHAGVGAARAVQLEVLHACHAANGPGDLALHGARVVLDLPAAIARAGIFNGELEPHAQLGIIPAVRLVIRMTYSAVRRLPVGAEVQPDGGTHFRIWAPDPPDVALLLYDERRIPLTAEPSGYFSAYVPDVGHGARYRYRAGGDLLADPASRFQPEGPDGPSSRHRSVALCLDRHGLDRCAAYGSDHLRTAHRHVHSAGHLGCRARAPAAAGGLGITVLEVMPVAEFPGEFGWGYDGVYLFAPTRLYGAARRLPRVRRRGAPPRPRRHPRRRLQPPRARREFLRPPLAPPTSRIATRTSGARRSTSTARTPRRCASFSAATPATGSTSSTSTACGSTPRRASIDAFGRAHPQADGPHRARARPLDGAILLIAENEPQDARLVRPPGDGGYGLDALWNDDFHHSAVVALTGRSEAYYTDYHGRPQEFVSAAKCGYLFQGQRYAWQKQRRGTPRRRPLARGLRQLPREPRSGRQFRRRQRACRQRTTAGPLPGDDGAVPADAGDADAVSGAGVRGDRAVPLLRRSRARACGRWCRRDGPSSSRSSRASPRPRCRRACRRRTIARPSSAAGSIGARRRARRSSVRLHADVIGLRRSEAAFAAQHAGQVDGAVLADEAFLLSLRGRTGRGRAPAARESRRRPRGGVVCRAAAGAARRLSVATRWSSDAPEYGGRGTPEIDRRARLAASGARRRRAAAIAPRVSRLEAMPRSSSCPSPNVSVPT